MSSVLVAVMKYRLPPTTNTCKARKCQASGSCSRFLTIQTQSLFLRKIEKQLVLSPVNLIEFPNTGGD